MVTIEEKIKLFTELIYQKIEKENQEEINKFNEIYSNLLNQKRREFQDYIKRLKEERIKKAQEESQKIVSRAKYEQKKLILKKRQELFETFINDLKADFKYFVETDKYKSWILKSLDNALKNITDNEFYITASSQTLNIIKNKIPDLKVNINLDENMIGGFILEDNNKIKIDFSLDSIVEENRERIGEILFSGL